jgi:hypothetical protein
MACLLFGNLGSMLVLIPKLNDLKSTAVNVEVDVALLKIGSDGLPNPDLRMQGLHYLPRRLPDALAVLLREDKE